MLYGRRKEMEHVQEKFPISVSLNWICLRSQNDQCISRIMIELYFIYLKTVLASQDEERIRHFFMYNDVSLWTATLKDWTLDYSLRC